MDKCGNRVTIKTIAEKANVSVATVSLALANKGRISPETRELVLSTARELNYRPNEAARALALQRYYEVGDESNTLFPPSSSIRYANTKKLLGIVEAEIAQLEQEGYDMSGLDQQAIQTLDEPTFEGLTELLEELKLLPLVSHYDYAEPSTLEGIRQCSTGLISDGVFACNSETLADSILGGWLGRTAGCVLGKPFEGLTKEEIISYLRLAESYPLNNYVPEVIPLPEGYRLFPIRDACMLGNISGAPPDDDLDFSVLCLHILEEYGLDVTTENIATEWLNHLPVFSTFTAERVAYENLVNDLRPPHTATYGNPWREYIGALIRGDCWGWVCPGNPRLSSELAYRDGRLSHIKNGIYGEMFVSAMLSMAPIVKDISQLIRIGLSYIPSGSRLNEAIRVVMKWHGMYPESWEETFEKVAEKYGHYNPVHVIPNCCIVVMALLYGKGDFDASVSIAVMAGWDTDCNGATTGSLLGTILGSSGIPRKWTAPLKDQIRTNVGRFSSVSIRECAFKTLALAEKFDAKRGGCIEHKHSSVISG